MKMNSYLNSGEPHCYFRGFAVYKFNDYIAHGTRQQYWEEPFTKAVMEGIQVNNFCPHI